MTETEIQADLKDEASRILAAVEERGLKVKLLGGIAIQLALGDRLPAALRRECGDIDFFTTKQHCSQVESLIEELGWEPESQFNAINGARRMLFTDPVHDRKIDGFVDGFEMCHKLPLDKRFDLTGTTLTPADLLLTKLQIIELNAKDRGDCYALLLGFPVNEDDPAAGIDTGWITQLTGKDWGLQHTLELNFERLRAGLSESGLDEAQRTEIGEAIGRIEAAIDAAPKSRSWKLRDRVGERKKWYDEPEEIG